MSENFIGKIVRQINALKPDLIVGTGDYVHLKYTRRELDGVWPVLNKLESKNGVGPGLGYSSHQVQLLPRNSHH